MGVLERGRLGLKAVVPSGLTDSLRSGVEAPLRLWYRGDRQYCPVCECASRTFLAYGVPEPRRNARCIHCGSLERHRLTWLFLQRRTNLFDGSFKRVLHVAPERIFQKRLRRMLGEGYLTADLYNPRAMIRMDVTDIPFGNDTFDVIYCSHVLEHVEDDRRAMREFCRVLKPGGWALLLVPISEEVTFEDPTVTDPAERARIFGQADHVRRYGADYADRLVSAGFDVQRFEPAEYVTEGEIARMRLVNERCDMYLCSPALAAEKAPDGAASSS